MSASSTPSGYPCLKKNGTMSPAPLATMQYCLFFVGNAWKQPQHLPEAARLVTSLNAALKDLDANWVFGQYIVPPNPSPPCPKTNWPPKRRADDRWGSSDRSSHHRTAGEYDCDCDNFWHSN